METKKWNKLEEGKNFLWVGNFCLTVQKLLVVEFESKIKHKKQHRPTGKEIKWKHNSEKRQKQSFKKVQQYITKKSRALTQVFNSLFFNIELSILYHNLITCSFILSLNTRRYRYFWWTVHLFEKAGVGSNYCSTSSSIAVLNNVRKRQRKNSRS